MEMPTRAAAVLIISTRDPRNIAATIPTGSALDNEITIANSVSSKVTGNLWMIASSTG
jgi:hypothetical protein